MKNILTIIFTLFMSLQLMAQETPVLENVNTKGVVSQKAHPKEGFQNFYENFTSEFNQENLNSSKREVVCRLRFVVENDGSFNNIEVLQDNDGIGQEAIRVLKTMPNWNPAKYNDEIVPSRFTLPIKIRVKKKSRLKRR